MNQHIPVPAAEQYAGLQPTEKQNRSARVIQVAAIALVAGMALTIAYLIGRTSGPPAPVASFRADICGTWITRPEHRCIHENQTGFEPGLYNPVFWPSIHRSHSRERFYLNRYWRPVAMGEPPRLVQFSGQLLILNALPPPGSSTPNYVARIWKNGRPAQTAGARIGVPAPQFHNAFVISLDMQDVAMPGDYYEVQLFASNANAEIDKHPLHTWWSGQ